MFPDLNNYILKGYKNTYPNTERQSNTYLYFAFNLKFIILRFCMYLCRFLKYRLQSNLVMWYSFPLKKNLEPFCTLVYNLIFGKWNYCFFILRLNNKNTFLHKCKTGFNTPLLLNSLGSRVQMSHEQWKVIHWEVLHLIRALKSLSSFCFSSKYNLCSNPSLQKHLGH